jgi:hypothetical protein
MLHADPVPESQIPVAVMPRDANLFNLLEGNHIMKVINVISFFKINTLALLIVPSLADNLPYFGKDMDLCLAYNMEEGTMESIQIEYFNLITAYMLHSLAESQSMVMLLYAFKNVRKMESSWRKTLMRLTRLSLSSPARPWRTLFHFPSVAYA